MRRSWSLVAAALGLAAGCWRAGPAAGVDGLAAPPTAPRATPAVELVPAEVWAACLTCDDQTLEGGVPLRFRHLPAASLDGARIAVVEERDGWGHVPVPGVRLLDRAGATVAWLPLGGVGRDAEAAVRAANAALARHAWTPLTRPRAITRALADGGVETTLAIGAFTVSYRQRRRDEVLRPPYDLRVVDHAGRVVVARRDAERAWHAPPRCNQPAFAPAGASAEARLVVFTTGLGLGDHACDGVEQRPAWHVLAF